MYEIMDLPKYIRSNISNLVFIFFIAIVYFSTDARTILIRGLMVTGLFNAEASTDTEKSDSNRSIDTNMTFRSEDGEVINLSENKGKVYFINFWATWCPPCRAEMPSINSLASKIKNKDKIELLWLM